MPFSRVLFLILWLIPACTRSKQLPPQEVVVQGSPAEMGAALGRAVPPAHQRLIEKYIRDLVGSDMARAKATAKRLFQQVPPRFVRELEAISRATSISMDYLRMINVAAELRLSGCTAFVDLSPPDGQGPLVGRNLDFPDNGVLHRTAMVVSARPTGRYAFLSLTWPGVVGAHTAINEKGLVVAELVVWGGQLKLQGVPYALLLRQILEEAATVEEAIAIVKKAPRTITHNLLFADPKAAAVVECSPSQVHVRSAPARGALLASNVFVQGKAPKAIRDERYIIMRRLTKAVPLTVARAKTILDTVGLGPYNVQAAVFRPAQRTLEASTGTLPATEGTYRTFTLKPLPRTPAKAAPQQ